jgi:hypothetical protein
MKADVTLAEYDVLNSPGCIFNFSAASGETKLAQAYLASIQIRFNIVHTFENLRTLAKNLLKFRVAGDARIYAFDLVSLQRRYLNMKCSGHIRESLRWMRRCEHSPLWIQATLGRVFAPIYERHFRCLQRIFGCFKPTAEESEGYTLTVAEILDIISTMRITILHKHRGPSSSLPSYGNIAVNRRFLCKLEQRLWLLDDVANVYAELDFGNPHSRQKQRRFQENVKEDSSELKLRQSCGQASLTLR